jgi:hypothetical protein
VNSALVGVLIGGGLTLLGSLLGQTAAHAFALRRERESRREARRTILEDVRLRAILELQEIAANVYADSALRSTLNEDGDIRQHRARLVIEIAKLAVPRSRIGDRATAQLIDSFIGHAITSGEAYDAGDYQRSDDATRMLKADLEALVVRTAHLLDAEQETLGRSGRG